MWTDAEREAARALLSKANGRRTARLLTFADLERTVDAALQSELGFSWASAGDAPDARDLTSVCLCVAADDHLTLGVAAAHGAATPASGWPDLTEWDRYRASANAAACLAWAGRRRPDRLRLPLRAPGSPASASRDELLAAVLAEPEDDAPRLVLADWLMERGDPRGEFISVQCELARGQAPSPQLKEREAALLQEHGQAWLGGHGPEVLQARFRRGFVERAVVLDSRALPSLDAWLLEEPVTELAFTSSHGVDGERLAAMRWLERLRSLEFRRASRSASGALSRERLAHLLESRRLRGLSRLVLVGQRLGDEGMTLLAAQGGASLPALDSLVVEGDAITDRGVAPLARSRWAARFRELSLADTQLGSAGAEALAEAPSPGRLRHLWLGDDGLGDKGAEALSLATRFKSLETLSLPRNRIGPAGLEALLDSRSLAQLTALDLTGNPVGSVGRKRLAARFP